MRAEAKAAAPSKVGTRLGAAYSEDSNMPDWHKGRRAGVILHPTSLPGPHGIGELGGEAFKFIDWLAGAGMQCWQVSSSTATAAGCAQQTMHQCRVKAAGAVFPQQPGGS